MSNEQIQIILNETTIKSDKYGFVSGNICFKIGDVFFPSAHWNDRIAFLLIEWMKAVLDLLDEQAHQVDLDFRKGPFKIVLSKSETRWSFKTIHYGALLNSAESIDKVFSEYLVNPIELLYELLDAAQKVVEKCSELNCDTQITLEIRQLMKKITPT